MKFFQFISNIILFDHHLIEEPNTNNEELFK